MKEQLDFVANTITSNPGVLVICLSILLWALIAFVFFRFRISPVVKGVDQAINNVKPLKSEAEFAENFEKFEEQISKNRILSHTWSEFSETLIKDPTIEPLAVRNTRSASEYFYRNSVIGGRVNIRFYSALPNLLTGTGILGTFVGLVAGIWLASEGLGSPNAEEVKQALQKLLNGASLAFMTSITGLITSILFSWREKHWIHKLDGRISTWNNELDRHLERVTGESLATDQLIESKQQTEILTQFTTELAFQIADAFQDRISSSLGPTLERLITAVEEMKEQHEKRNDDALHSMIEKFSETLSGSAGKELTTLGETLSNLNDKIESQIGALGERQEQISEASQKSIDDLSKVFRWSLAQIKSGIGDTLAEVTEKMGGLINQMNNSIDSATHLSSEFKQVLANTGEAVNELNNAANSLSLLATPIADTSATFKETAEDIKAVTERNEEVSSQIGRSVSSITDLQTELKDSWARYEDRFEQVDASMAKVMQEMFTGLDNYTERVKEFVSGLDKHTSSIVSDLAGANSELSTAVEELTDALTRVRE